MLWNSLKVASTGAGYCYLSGEDPFVFWTKMEKRSLWIVNESWISPGRCSIHGSLVTRLYAHSRRSINAEKL